MARRSAGTNRPPSQPTLRTLACLHSAFLLAKKLHLHRLRSRSKAHDILNSWHTGSETRREATDASRGQGQEPARREGTEQVKKREGIMASRRTKRTSKPSPLYMAYLRTNHPKSAMRHRAIAAPSRVRCEKKVTHFLVHSIAFWLYLVRSVLYRFAISGVRGSSGLGSVRSEQIESRTAEDGR